VWGAGHAFAGLGIFVVLIFCEVAIVAAFDSDLESLGAKLGVQAMLALTMVAVALAVAGARAAETGSLSRAARALGLRRPQPPYVGATIAAYLVYIGCAFVIATLLDPQQEDVTRELGADDGVLGTIVAGLLIVVAAPLAEEVFFRGFLFAGIRRSAGFVVAALVSSLIWGFFHFTGESGSWGVVVQLSVFGVILAWLYERTGSIWPTIAVHALNNAIAFTYLIST
jgi:membrane protease YdiL (CAAX protease family)